MDPVTVIETLTAAANAAMELYAKYEQGQIVLSETDAKAVHEALLKAEDATTLLRPKVDAALDAAIARGN